MTPRNWSRGCTGARAVLLAGLLLLLPATASAGASVPGIVKRHAPLVWLHSSERLWPMSADAFVERSALQWSRRPGCADTLVARAGDVTAGRLGAGAAAHGGAYRQSITAAPPSAGVDLCLPGPFSRASHDYTRPESHRKEGFYLNLADAERIGTAPRCPPGQPRCGVYRRAPVYYEYSRRRYVTYWYFFGYSSPVSGAQLFDRLGHEGDWERISIRLDETSEPTEVAYWQHSGDPSTANRKLVQWRELEALGSVKQGHPVVFVARGSHASYPKACRKLLGRRFCFNDLRNDGWRWTTSEHLRDVTAQPWYGFGGAWGTLGQHGNFVGPAGPGPNGLACHKPPVPRAWLQKGNCA
jgi:hypothetical protein